MRSRLYGVHGEWTTATFLRRRSMTSVKNCKPISELKQLLVPVEYSHRRTADAAPGIWPADGTSGPSAC